MKKEGTQLKLREERNACQGGLAKGHSSRSEKHWEREKGKDLRQDGKKVRARELNGQQWPCKKGQVEKAEGGKEPSSGWGESN